jgi:hypothetical protein
MALKTTTNNATEYEMLKKRGRVLHEEVYFLLKCCQSLFSFNQVESVCYTKEEQIQSFLGKKKDQQWTNVWSFPVTNFTFVYFFIYK